VDGLVDALQQLHDNPALAERLAFSGQDRVREHFNAQKQGLVLSRLLESWLENASTPSHTAL
jgi:hypothetical protein